MSENITSVTDANFDEEVLKSELPVLVDFWAVWCGPCQMIAPTVDYLAENYTEKMKVVKMNVDESMSTPAKYSAILALLTLNRLQGINKSIYPSLGISLRIGTNIYNITLQN